MKSTDEKLSAAERRRRQQAIDYARASVALEGSTLTEKDERHAQRYIDGKIDLAAFVRVES